MKRTGVYLTEINSNHFEILIIGVAAVPLTLIEHDCACTCSLNNVQHAAAY